MTLTCPSCGDEVMVLKASGQREKVCDECSKKRGDTTLDEMNAKAKGGA